MPNRNYQRGRRLEWRVKKSLEQDGWTCTRAAGSHSPFDIIGVRAPSEPVLCIQLKLTGSLSQAKRLLATFIPRSEDSPSPTYSHELWVWFDGRKTGQKSHWLKSSEKSLP